MELIQNTIEITYMDMLQCLHYALHSNNYTITIIFNYQPRGRDGLYKRRELIISYIDLKRLNASLT